MFPYKQGLNILEPLVNIRTTLRIPNFSYFTRDITIMFRILISSLITSNITVALARKVVVPD